MILIRTDGTATIKTDNGALIRIDGAATIKIDNGAAMQAVVNKLDALLLGQKESKAREVVMARTVDELVAAVDAQTGRVASLETYIATANQLIRDALAGATLPPEVQAKLDAAMTGLESNTGRIAAAIESNPLPA